MYSLGIRTVRDVAGYSSQGLVAKLGNINVRQAIMIVKSAQYTVKEQIDNIRAQINDLVEGT
jgi:hypothetical protein